MKIDNDVIDVLKTSRAEKNMLFIDAKLERDLYLKVNKVLKLMQGKWSSAKHATLFPKDVEDILQEIIITGEYVSEKKEFQFYETPTELAKRMVEMANILPWGENCLEPSAGKGNIAQFMPEPDCIELNPDNRKALQNKGFNLIWDDFLTFEPKKKYHIIIMNPPFWQQMDIRHITKAIEIAEDMVIAICSPAFQYRTDKRSVNFRDLLRRYNTKIEDLDPGTFKSSGTMISTCLLSVRKN